jgi:hypothetical protein
MRSRDLAKLCPFVADRLPSGAFPTSGSLAAFTVGFAFGPRPVAFVTLAGFDLGLGTLPSIRG